MSILKMTLLFLPCAACAWDNLDYGIPGACDQIIEREGYALGYSRRLGQPRWVSYRLTADEATNRVIRHSRPFYYDSAVRTGTAYPGDYDGSKYARGHLAPAADMRFSTNVLYESYSMANVSPQWPGFNVGVWKRLEEHVRNLAIREGPVFIVTGPVFSTNAADGAQSVSGIPVPDGFYKVVFVERPPHRRMLGYIVPNVSSRQSPRQFETSVDAVEEATGLDFFYSLPLDEQTRLEQGER